LMGVVIAASVWAVAPGIARTSLSDSVRSSVVLVLDLGSFCVGRAGYLYLAHPLLTLSRTLFEAGTAADGRETLLVWAYREATIKN
ncbi:hypothetical protein OC845_006578, partial [Tilletia horrida]